MSGISGPGGSSLRAGGVGGVEPSSGGGEAPAGASDAAATGGAPRTRPRSLDAQGIGLAASLHASFESSATATPSTTSTSSGGPAPMTTPPKTLAEIEARMKSLPRAADGGGFYFDAFAQKLRGRVTTDETEYVLGELELTPPEHWLATVEKLGKTPSDEPGLSLLDKFVKYGVNDRNRFIARFADMANKKLGLGLPTVQDRAFAHEAEGMRHGRANRLARREVRGDSDVVLDYFKAKDKQGFVNGLRATGEGIVDGVGMVVTAPFVLLGILILKGKEF